VNGNAMSKKPSYAELEKRVRKLKKESAISFYGWNYRELAGKKITDINTLTTDQVFREMARAKKEKRRHYYFRHCLSNGQIRDVEVYSGPITVEDRKLLYVFKNVATGVIAYWIVGVASKPI